MNTNLSTRSNTQAKSFSYSFESAKSVEEIFELLLSADKWWSGLYEETITGASSKVNDEFFFTAGGGMHNTRQRLIELVPNQKIVWLVTESNLTFLNDSHEWMDTKICFDISQKKDKTWITFTHEGLVPEIECYENCSMAWTGYMEKLKDQLK